jgi:hypothetical protein
LIYFASIYRPVGIAPPFVQPVRKPHPTEIGKKIDDYWDAAQASTIMLKDPKTFVLQMTGYKRD